LNRDRIEAEEELRISYRFLEVVHKHREMAPLLDEYVAVIKEYTGCNAVGIRILDETGGIPYRSYDGFSPQFYDTESPLSINTDQCMCINVIKGSIDPVKPFYTEGGSFYMNGTTRFLAMVSEETKGRTRNVCNREGYESVALVPFWSDGRILGLIHVADRRENMVPLKTVEILEKAAMQLGTALHRILAEEELRRSEERYRYLFENMLEGYAYCKMVFDGQKPLDFVYINVNNAFEKLTGLKNVAGKKVTEVVPHIRETNPELFEAYGRVALTGKPERFETFVNALRIWFCISVYSPEKGYFVAVFDNITERKKAEEEIQIRDVAIQSSISPIGLADLNGNIIFANGSYIRLWGYDDLKEIVGKHISEFAVAREQGAEVTASLLSGKGYVGEGEAVKKDGSTFDVQISANLVRSREGKPVCLMASFVDITDRKRAEKALQESERNYRNLVDNALAGVYRSTIEGRFLYVNEAMSRIFECGSPEEMLSEKVQLRYKNPKDREGFIEKIRQDGSVSNYEIEVPTKRGRLITILISATLDNEIISGMVLDISGHKKLEEQFLQAQKIEAVGLLAGGVAHDFNNILSAIMGYSQIVLMKMKGDDPLRHHLEQIMESSNRATVLTQSLLAFSRKQPVNLAVIDLNTVIMEFEKFLLRLIREDITLETTYEGGALNVLADKGQIEQLIMNLVTNARDAMPEGGRLLIATKNVCLDQDFIESHGYGKAGEYAFVTVTDTGCGMDGRTIARVFEPFFTTKEQGKGTGLGLSMVYGTVKRHDGFITVYSEPGNGTTFKIYLPLVRLAAKAAPQTAKKPAVVRGGAETILLAEDDAALRKLNTIVLTNFGYPVIEAVDGEDAVSKFRENQDRIQLVILDGIMPKMNGADACGEIKALSPDIKCIFMSGYAEEIFTKNSVPFAAEFVLKPISPTDLVKKIREVLDR